MLRRDGRISPFVFSLLLHALILVLVVTGFAAPRDEGATARLADLFPNPEPVNVRLLNPAEAPRMLVDASGAPERAPEEPTNLVSERDSRAADRGPRDLPEGDPFNRGETSLPNPTPGEGGRDDGPRERAAPGAQPPARASQEARPPAAGGAQAEAPGAADQPDAASGVEPGSSGELAQGADPSRLAQAPPVGTGSSLGDSRLALPRHEVTLPPASAPPRNAGAPGTGRRGLPQVDNRLTRARFDEDFSLSTYAWDYAPYMTRLKRQIEDYTWTILPSAFWYGIAAWTTQVRFTILPSGQLESVAIVGHQGVLELRHVAPDAVSGSADFEPLPTGFPDPKLVIQGNFYFNEFPPARGAAEAGRPGRSGGNGAAGAADDEGAADSPPSAGPGTARGDS
jgi:hypothetical protein